MHFTKSTTRALAVSVAFVAAGATVAGAAAFQLPILGFGRANVASAIASPARATATVAVVRPKVKPKVIVKTRYVNDIVHRHAPARAYALPAAPAAAAHATMARPSSTVVPAPAMESPSMIAASSSTTTSPTTVWSEDGPDRQERESEPDDGHSTDTVPGQAPVVDQ